MMRYSTRRGIASLPRWKHLLRELLAVLLAGSGLAGCGGGTGGAVAEPVSEPVVEPTTPPPVAHAEQTMRNGFVVQAGLPPGGTAPGPLIEDTDADGFPDRIDPDPAVAAQPGVEFNALQLARVGGVLEAGVIWGMAHADRPLQLEAGGTALRQGAMWALLEGRDAQRLVPVPAASDNTGFVLPAAALQQPFRSIRLLTPHWYSNALVIDYRATGQAAMLPPDPAQRGQSWVLNGIHLQSVVPLLNGQPLAPVTATPSQLVLEVPLGADSGWLELPGDDPYRLPVRVSRQIDIRADADLLKRYPSMGVLTGESLQAGQAVQHAVDSVAPEPVRVQVEGEGAPLLLGFVAWPDRHAVVIDADAILTFIALRSGRINRLIESRSWQSQREVLESWLAGPHGARARELLEQALEDGSADAIAALYTHNYRSLAAVVQTYAEPATAKIATTERTLADVFTSRVNVVDGRGNVFLASRSNGFSVGSIAENGQCQSLAAQDPEKSRISPSDLCVESANEASASIQVRDGHGDSGAVLASHVNPNGVFGVLDANILGGTGGYFNVEVNILRPGGLVGFKRPAVLLKAGAPPDQPTAGSNFLCDRKPCQVEIITGASGLGSNVELNGQEERVHKLIEQHTLLNVIILPLISQLIEGIDDDALKDLSCVTKVLGTSIGSLQNLTKLYQDVAGAPRVPALDIDGNPIVDEGGVQRAEIDPEVLAKILSDNLRVFISNILGGSNGLAVCIEKSLVNSASSVINEQLDDAAKAFNRSAPGRFLQLVETLNLVGQLALTPRRLTFRVSPLSLVTNVAPAELDLDNALAADIVISGRRLGLKRVSEEQPDGSFTGEQDEAEPDVLPTVVMRAIDSVGTPVESTFPLTDRQFVGSTGFSDATDTITIPAAAVRRDFVERHNVAPGRIEVALQYDAEVLPDVPEFTRERFELPAGDFELLKPLTVARELPLRSLLEGEVLLVAGTRLESLPFGSADFFLRLTPGRNGSPAPAFNLYDIDLVRESDGSIARRNGQSFIAVRVPELDEQGSRSASYAVRLHLPAAIETVLATAADRGAAGTDQGLGLGIIELTTRDDVRTLIVYDDGDCADDSLRVELRRGADGSGGLVDAATDETLANPVLETSKANNYSGVLKWNNDALGAGNTVGAVNITCVEGLNDCSAGTEVGVCTVGLIYQIEGVPVGRDANYVLEQGQSQIVETP